MDTKEILKKSKKARRKTLNSVRRSLVSQGLAKKRGKNVEIKCSKCGDFRQFGLENMLLYLKGALVPICIDCRDLDKFSTRKKNPARKKIVTKKFFPVTCNDTGEIVYSYPSYLRTEHWKRFRKIIRKRGGCQVCSSSEKLEVHHLTYQFLGKELPKHVKLLCSECHSESHDIINSGAIKSSHKFRKGAKAFKKRAEKICILQRKRLAVESMSQELKESI